MLSTFESPAGASWLACASPDIAAVMSSPGVAAGPSSTSAAVAGHTVVTSTVPTLLPSLSPPSPATSLPSPTESNAWELSPCARSSARVTIAATVCLRFGPPLAPCLRTALFSVMLRFVARRTTRHGNKRVALLHRSSSSRSEWPRGAATAELSSDHAVTFTLCSSIMACMWNTTTSGVARVSTFTHSGLGTSSSAMTSVLTQTSSSGVAPSINGVFTVMPSARHDRRSSNSGTEQATSNRSSTGSSAIISRRAEDSW